MKRANKPMVYFFGRVADMQPYVDTKLVIERYRKEGIVPPKCWGSHGSWAQVAKRFIR